MDKQQKNDFTNKLKHLLATPSDTRAFFEDYQGEHSEASFDEYTKSLEDLVDQLQDDQFEDSESFCREVMKLHLPSNQFNC